jgi:hypothetical protein
MNYFFLCVSTAFSALQYVRIIARREDFSRQRPPAFVAQVSKPAVSPTSLSAERPQSCNLRVWKPATQQTWKSALLGLRLRRAVPLRLFFAHEHAEG